MVLATTLGALLCDEHISQSGLVCKSSFLGALPLYERLSPTFRGHDG